MKRKRRQVPMDQLEAIVERSRSALSQEEHGLLASAIETLAEVTRELEVKGVTIARLRQMLFGARSEKTGVVLGEKTDTEPKGDEAGDTEKTGTPEQTSKRKGHGRNGARAYAGAQRRTIPHLTLTHGQRCPQCQKGKLYHQAQAKTLVRITAMAPISALVCECERLRCNGCGEIFTAQAPPEIGTEKYDESVAAMVALLKYGTGLTFYRIARLQKSLGIPLPASTQWDLVSEAADGLGEVFEELCRQAAQAKLLHNDDTTGKILELIQPRERDPICDGDRVGVYTSAIVATEAGREIALFFTGNRHAGENLAALLARRQAERPLPIQMCDALSHNTAGEFESILANCMAHARRKFVDVKVSFPEECRYVLETLRDVYRNDAHAREQAMSDEQRLALHQAESGPIMEKLESWLAEQIQDKKIEPNSGAGEAIGYMRKHWDKLTLFLRVAGAPLDNNVCERALKKAILHRKNALFYRTLVGARVGDLYMSLIYTAERNEIDPFDYLVAVARHREPAKADPAAWMPWTYRQTLQRRAAQAQNSS